MLQISGVYTKGHSRVFYFKIEAHLQSQPKNVGQVATLWFTRIPNIYFITIAQPRSHWVRALHWPVRPARLHDRPLVCTNSPSASHAVLTISHGEVGRPHLLRTHPAARCETSHTPSVAMWFWRLRMDSAIWSWGSGRCAWSFHHG